MEQQVAICQSRRSELHGRSSAEETIDLVDVRMWRRRRLRRRQSRQNRQSAVSNGMVGPLQGVFQTKVRNPPALSSCVSSQEKIEGLLE